MWGHCTWIYKIKSFSHKLDRSIPKFPPWSNLTNLPSKILRQQFCANFLTFSGKRRIVISCKDLHEMTSLVFSEKLLKCFKFCWLILTWSSPWLKYSTFFLQTYQNWPSLTSVILEDTLSVYKKMKPTRDGLHFRTMPFPCGKLPNQNAVYFNGEDPDRDELSASCNL